MGLWQRARDAFTVLRQGMPGRVAAFEAGRVKRTDPDFTPMMIGPNALNDRYLDLARRRIRWLCDNHPLIRGARNVFVNNVVGENGIMVEPDTEWPELNKQIKDRWYAWEEAADVGRELSMALLQRQFAEDLFAGGDAIWRAAVTRGFKDEPAGIAVEIFAPEQMDIQMRTYPGAPLPGEGAGPGAGGLGLNRVRQGVEFDELGRRVAFHVYEEHPQDNWALIYRTKRIPADDAVLGMFGSRPRQVRGVPVPIAAVEATRMEDGYQEANILTAMAAACAGLYFEGIDVSQLSLKNPSMPIDLATGMPITSMAPGMVGGGPVGTRPSLLAQNVPGQQFEAVLRQLAQRMATATGTAYTDVTGDYSQTTFSSERARILATRKGYKAPQLVIDQATNRTTYRAFVRYGITFGQIALNAEQRAAWAVDPRRLFRYRPLFPGGDWVNPQQEATATQISLAAGIESPIRVIAEKGRHFSDVIDERIKFEVEWNQKREKAGLPPKDWMQAAGGGAPAQDTPADDNTPQTKPQRKANAARPTNRELIGLAAAALGPGHGYSNGHLNGHAAVLEDGDA